MSNPIEKREEQLRAMGVDEKRIKEIAHLNLNFEACRTAKHLAGEFGGKPNAYMKQAWGILREEYPELFEEDKPKAKEESKIAKEEERESRKEAREREREERREAREQEREEREEERKREAKRNAREKTARSVLGWIGRATKKTATSTKNNWNMFRAPNDRPSDVFSGLEKSLTKRPDKIDLPPGLGKEISKLFKFW